MSIGPAPGLVVGAPGGMVAPPGGLAAPPLPPLAPLILAPRLPHPAGPGGQETPGTGRYPLTPPLGGAPGGALPGAGVMPLALPDLNAAARSALESVVERAPEPARLPPAPETAPIGSQTPHVAPAQVGWGALPPPPPAVAHQGGAVPGVWVPPAPLDRRSWPGAVAVPEERDLAQRAGDRLYPLVERIRDSRIGWVGVVALFGLTVPIILLRQRFDVRARLILAALVFLFWVGLIQDLG